MAVTAASFRATFPAFGDVGRYADIQVEMFITLYTQMVNADRWGDLTDFGISLAVAHNLALETQNTRQSQKGAVPGSSVGIVNSKSVDKISLGYDVTTGTEAGAGYWNLTNYGIRYYKLAMMFGAGPVQVGTGGGTYGSFGAWPGPIF